LRVLWGQFKGETWGKKRVYVIRGMDGLEKLGGSMTTKAPGSREPTWKTVRSVV